MLLRLLDAVLPPLCLGCNEIVAEPGALCAACWPAFSFIAAPHCSRCGTPFAEPVGPVQGGNVQCGTCLRWPPRFRKARAALVYDDESKRVVLPFKHGDRTDMARACGRWMARAGSDLLAEAELIAPVPLHWRRLFTRRYNQALLLARAVARHGTAHLVPDLLLRERWTGSQGTLRAEERRRNVRRAFGLHPRWRETVKGKAVLLVDDVLTTGATVDACTLALQRAGVRHVDVLTLARAIRAA